MNEKEKQDYLEKYHQEKEKGVPFFQISFSRTQWLL
jgi:hypothetical protein